ncbi:trehalose-phosphatase [candidate division TA06 bacterium]|uniref:Trehalose 6-phosphate phosphatase n=1 Tax=candidate division TA06 bacterium TaxID=2250710 RepID=A0A933ML58_UNCT6|nr:trehalose-phosphatase [candidate division TA06 bacterium]
MLDYDGTLAPIVSDPARARLDREMLAVLKQLAARDDLMVAVISGRALADLKRKVRLDSIYYAGCHGMEMEGPGWSYVHPKMEMISVKICHLENYLRGILGRVRGSIIENKRYALTVHYRKVAARDRRKVEEVARQAEKSFSKWLKMEPGRMSFEYKPTVNWNKGKSVEILLRLHRANNPYPIYIGDDLTDESAFKRMLHKGLGILVNNNERPYQTSAVIRIRSVRHVRQFLQYLAYTV